MPGDVRIKLLPKQALFMSSKTRGTIYRGGIGSGKTRILCYKAIENASQLNRRECIVSATNQLLKDVVLFTLLNDTPEVDGALKCYGYFPSINCEINLTEKRVRFPGGGEILLRSGDDPDSLRGLNLHDVYIDEARLFKSKDVHDILLGRLRNANDCKWYICSSPRGKDWVWNLAQNDPNVTLIIQKTRENTLLPKGYIEDMRSRYTEQFAEQELNAGIIELHGGIIDSSRFKVIPYIRPSQGVRYWDLAISEKKSADKSAGALCLYSGIDFTVAEMQIHKLVYPKLKEVIIQTALRDGTGVVIGIEAAGQQMAIIDDLRVDRRLGPYTIKAMRPRGDKVARAMPWSSQAELGRMSVMDGSWVQDFREECDAFTADDTHMHDDQVDAVSGAYAILTHRGTAAYAYLPI